MKNGIQTSESWLAVAGSAAAVQQAISDPDWQVKVAALAVLGAICCVYLWSRTRLKEASTPSPEAGS